MSRLTRTQLANAIVMWNNGKGTWKIAQSLERIRIHGKGATKSNGEITEAMVANSLAAWREEKRKDIGVRPAPEQKDRPHRGCAALQSSADRKPNG